MLKSFQCFISCVTTANGYQCFVVGRFILVVVFIYSTNICNHFYSILVGRSILVTVLVLVNKNMSFLF